MPRGAWLQNTNVVQILNVPPSWIRLIYPLRYTPEDVAGIDFRTKVWRDMQHSPLAELLGWGQGVSARSPGPDRDILKKQKVKTSSSCVFDFRTGKLRDFCPWRSKNNKEIEWPILLTFCFKVCNFLPCGKIPPLSNNTIQNPRKKKTIKHTHTHLFAIVFGMKPNTIWLLLTHGIFFFYRFKGIPEKCIFAVLETLGSL